VRIPVRPHFGVIALAPREADIVDSTPPGYFGGNIDDWRIGKGATMYYPVAVAGGLLSVGDPHASQGDSELCGTAIECSLTGTFQLILHKRDRLEGTPLADLQYPLGARAAAPLSGARALARRPPRRRADRAKHIGRGEAEILWRHRPAAGLPPHSGQAVLLADARLVLKPHLDSRAACLPRPDSL
jgi:hypothetical protein